MILFALGIIIGLLINPTKNKFEPLVLKKLEDGLSGWIPNIIAGKSEFIEPISPKEKFDQANSIADLLEK